MLGFEPMIYLPTYLQAIMLLFMSFYSVIVTYYVLSDTQNKSV